MKQALVFAAFGMLAIGSAAQAAPVVWQGAVTVTYVNGPQCAGSHNALVLGLAGLSVYRPRLLAGDQDSGITMIFARDAYAFYRSSGPDQYHGNGSSRVIRINAYAQPAYVQPAQNQPAFEHLLHNLTITPSVITAQTQTVKIVGYMQNLGGGLCTFGFTADYSKLPKKQINPPAL
jgi:hypothetical protein